MSEKYIFDLPLCLPSSLESKRSLFEKNLIDSQKRLKKFAIHYGWKNHLEESFADKVILFDDRKNFKEHLINHCDLDSSIEIPETYSAGLENRILFAVSPQLYEEGYPQGIEAHYYEKLLCHEMIHRLHVKILAGDEEKMGPIWFFEGFAIFGSNQFENTNIEISESEIWDTMTDDKRGDYRKYGAILRYWLKKKSLQELVYYAGSDKLYDWLKQ